MFKVQNKGIAIALGLIIVAVAAAVLGGSFFVYKKITQKQETKPPVTNTQNENTNPFENTNNDSEVKTEDKTITKTNETVGWKTYINAEYGFEIKYPTDWRESETFKVWLKNNFTLPKESLPSEVIVLTALTQDQENEVLIPFKKEALFEEMGPGFCTVHYADGKQIMIEPAYLSDYRFFADYVDSLTSAAGEQKASDFKKMEHNSVETVYQYRYYLSWEGCGVNQKITYFRYPKSKIINGKTATGLFIKMEANKDGTFNENLYNNFVSSFKFIDETAGWKTYTDSKYGFEIKYPENWQISNDTGPRSRGEILKTISNLASNHVLKVIFEMDTKDNSQSLAQHAAKIECLLTGNEGEMPPRDCNDIVVLAPFIKLQQKIYFEEKEGIKQELISTAGVAIEIYIPINNQSVLVIYTFGGTIDDGTKMTLQPQFVSIFDQMLSTFKFTK